MARAFHVCFMYLIKMTAFIASNAVLLLISYVKWTIFKSKKRSASCCKWIRHYNTKSVSPWGATVLLTFLRSRRSYHLCNDSLVGEQGWVLLEQYRFTTMQFHFLLFLFTYVFINAFCYFSMYRLKV